MLKHLPGHKILSNNVQGFQRSVLICPRQFTVKQTDYWLVFLAYLKIFHLFKQCLRQKSRFWCSHNWWPIIY